MKRPWVRILLKCRNFFRLICNSLNGNTTVTIISSFKCCISAVHIIFILCTLYNCWIGSISGKINRKTLLWNLYSSHLENWPLRLLAIWIFMKIKWRNFFEMKAVVNTINMIQPTLTLKMTTAQIVKTSVTVNNNSPILDYAAPGRSCFTHL